MSRGKSVKEILAAIETKIDGIADDISELKDADSKFRDDLSKHDKDQDAHGLGGAKLMFRMVIAVIGLGVAIGGFLISVIQSVKAGG